MHLFLGDHEAPRPFDRRADRRQVEWSQPAEVDDFRIDALCGEGLCIGYDGGDAVSSDYKPKFELTGGKIVKVVFDVADDTYVDVERNLAAAMARD